MMRGFEFVPNHGHTAAECDALNASDAVDRAKLATKGMTISVSTDFHALKALNAEHQDYGYGPLMPIYDPAFEDVSEDNGFWVCVEKDGVPVAIMSGRMREVRDFRAALGDNTFLMGPNPPEGSITNAKLSAIDGWSGPIAYIGALWVHPAHQGTFLSRIMVGAVVRTAWYRWAPTRIVAVIAASDIPLALYVYGFQVMHGLVTFKDPRWKSPPRCVLLSISQDEVRDRFLQMGGQAAQSLQPTRTA